MLPVLLINRFDLTHDIGSRNAAFRQHAHQVTGAQVEPFHIAVFLGPLAAVVR